MLIPKTKDGRVVFLIPFQGRWLLGTTDDEVSNGKGEALLERKELDYLLETLNPFLDQPVGPDAVLAGFGGYRPLISDHRAGTKGLLRDHAVELDSLSGLFSLLGGKWTTYRIMAKDAIDQIAYFLGRVEQCRTADIPLKGATQLKESDWERWCQEQDLPKDIAQHLYRCYGACAKEVANIMQQSAVLAKRIIPDFPFVLAEIKYAVQVEKCCTLRDFLARRIRLEILDWKSTLQAVPVVAQVMAKELSWSESEQQSQSEGYIELLEGFIQQTI
jgi:glycerol-3-phosphate dehydrogenase